MKSKLVRILVIYSAGFLLFFIFRLIYGFFNYPTTETYFQGPGSSGVNQSQGREFTRRNYASKKIRLKGGVTGPQQSIDQKYEKVAQLRSRSHDFENDAKKIRTQIKSFKALIQYEKRSGLKGNRSLFLAIGVNPARFDEFIGTVRQIGRIQSISVNKTDKTNEFKDLKAKRLTLEKTRNALIALKNRGGKIKEYMGLENRILEIEEKIQKLGIRLGDYDAENEFCTVKFSLREGRVRSISFLRRIKVALEWSIKYYLLFIFLNLLVLVSSLIGVKLLKLLGWAPEFIREYWKKV